MADIKKSVNLLPEYLRTDKNSKFLSSTIDQFIQTPQVERLDGFVGSKITPNYNPSTDFYLDELSSLRNNYSLEPALIFKDANNNITDVVAYDDLINELGIQGGKNTNLDSIFNSKFYSYDPLIDWDKLINFTDYYWLPTGPDIIVLLDVELSDIVSNATYAMPNGYMLSNGMKIEVAGTVYLVEGVGSSIKLIDYTLLDSYDNTASVFDEKFDNVEFDEYPFDGDKKLPLTPDYITINRASSDLNPWTRYNRWFHKEVIRITSEINNVSIIYPLDSRAKRPIIEFKPNLQLYNFGKKGIKNIDLIDTVTIDAFATVDGTFGYYVDGILLQQGHRVVFNADSDIDVCGKVFVVNFDITGPVPILRLIGAEDLTPSDMDSTSVNLGTEYYGTSWYFNSSIGKWIFAQQHTKLNQPPLFDMFTKDNISYTNIADANNFTGNQIFGYEIGTGANDEVLGFPLKYQNNIGAGSYLFKNYFMSESITLINNNVSRTISTAVAYLKLDNNLTNVWAESVNYKIPVLETQTVQAETNTITLTCLDSPIDTNLTVSVYVNNVKVSSTISATSSKVELTTSKTLLENDVVLLKIETDQAPNANGYYETPIGLTNNPLNGTALNLTLSELGDHLSTMIGKTPAYTGTNLRDLADYSKYGSRLVVNSNPIAFAQVFLGKKEHNVVDAIRSTGEHYSQFKMNFLRSLTAVDSQLSAADALDIVLQEINKAKDLKSSYQRSDMLGYGQNKTVRTFTVTNISNFQYPIGFEFDLTRLSFQSVLVYHNEQQLIHNRDYVFNYTDGSIEILKSLEVDDIITINCYLDTLGSYIPPTPSKLGLYPTSIPLIFSNTTSATGPVQSIQCHDGSIMTAYGDYRDAIILEFETRIYNNIKTQYNKNLFDIISFTPGAFRSKPYTTQDVNGILINDFSRWAGIYGVDISSNTTFDEGNAFTWNYTGSIDNVFGNEVSGTWKNLFEYFYNTQRPNITPWQMLGISEEPVWWVDEYGPAPYRSTNTKLWTDLRDGYVRGIDTYLPEYTRPNLLSIIPVNSVGNLRSPNTFLVSNNSYQDKQASWKFGDFSPAENAWRNSSEYRFSIISAAALLDPCTFCSNLYDVSRTTVSIIGQTTYKEDDLYLNPSKLLIEGENNSQIAGFGVYVMERGRQKDQDYITKLRQDLEFIDVNLFHKVGGFVSKEKLQIIIDSIDPTSTSPGVILPSEDYSLILNVSNPIKTARISGIIIQKSNGKFIIKGYDVANPYFEILRPIASFSSGAVKVGGVSEEFSEWSNIATNGNSGLSVVDTTSAESPTGRYYKQGQLLRYNNKFYRVKIGHNATATFDASLFQALPELPVKGGAVAQIPSRFESTVTRITYGSELSTVQEVYDVILGYGAYLETQGFIFDEYNTDLNEILNWKFSGKEFLYWTTQNWADGNLITLSPFANYIKYNFPNSVVDNISTGKYEYSLLKADGKPYPIDRFTMSREDTICTIKTRDANEGLFFATLNSVQKEHGMVFNNFTVFNDTIYDIETGYKQRRIKLAGFRTKNWNGDLFSPGFVYDNVEIADWQPYKKYLPGKVVRYNGKYYESLTTISTDAIFDFTKWDQLANKPVAQLLPNFDYKIDQFEDFYSLDIDNFDFDQQQLAQHLTGYTPRTYLNNIFTNPISQYKFYQGMIKDKGTKNAVNKLSKASEFANKGEISFKEEWAFRIGNYGSFETLNEIEFSLEEGTSLENPYLVKFVDSLPTDQNPLINYVTKSNLLLTPADYLSTATNSVYPSTWLDNNLKLTTAGYVRLDDVTSTAYNKNSLLDIANNAAIQDGDTVWLGFQENGDWTVYRYTKQLAEITGVFVSAPGSEITFVTDTHHNLQIGDVISVVRFNDQVNGVYIVNSIVAINQFTVSSVLSSIENEELLNYGTLYKFEEARYDNLNELSQVTDLLKLNAGDKVWIDEGIANKWQVYEKIKNYSASVSDTINTPPGQQFGSSIFASDDSPVMLVSAPSWYLAGTFGHGRVKVFNKINNAWVRKYDYTLNSSQKTYCSPTRSTQFGYSLQYDIAKKLYVTGAPEATYVRATGTNLLTFSTGTGYVRPYINEGLVKIDSRQEDFPVFTEIVIANPNPANNSRFGHSVCISQVASTVSTTLLVGAPGINPVSNIGSVYAYNITSTSTIGVHSQGIDLYSAISLSSGDEWGYKIAGCSIGFAISAPGYLNDTGVVQLFNKNLVHSQTIYSPFGVNGRFGHDIAISDSGNYLLISAPEIKNINEPYGKIAVYKNNLGLYVLDQIIHNPLPTNDLKFGYSISISKDEKTVGIGALGKTRSQEQIFDEYSNSGKTTFDNDSTTFDEVIPDAGTVYLYNKIGEKFIQADELNDVRIVEDTNIVFPIPVNIFTPVPTGPVISNIKLSEDPSNVGNTIIVTFSTDVDLDDTSPGGLIAQVDRLDYGPYGGTIQNSPNREHYFYIDTSRFSAGIRNLAIRVVNKATGAYGYAYTTFTLNPAVFTITAGSRYGSAVVVTNDNVFVGAPTYQSNLLSTPTVDASRLFIFNKIDTQSLSWKVLRQQEDTVDVSVIGRVALIDTLKEEIIDYLDVIDPVKGKIAGIAEQELTYKAAFDPATYSIGLASTIVNTETNWLDDHLGELWWDLSTAKYTWYEQGDDIFRKNNWGKLFPGASIDVYEWVKSDLLPSEWAAQADTTKGLAASISGQPKYSDNSVVSVKQIFNNVTGSFENVYYFWVKNKVTLPAVKNRRLSSFQVANYIADPVANGLRFIEIISPSAVAFANVQPLLVSNNINANITTDYNSDTPKHTEWLLLNEGDYTSVPSTLLEKKLFDSLLGHDNLGNNVPNKNLTYRNRYGIGIRPQQTLFKDRLAALRNLISFANSVLRKNRIVGNYSFENLNKVEEIPALLSYEYDLIVEDNAALNEVFTVPFVQVTLECYAENGKIKNVIIVNPGFGYVVPPKVNIIPSPGYSGSGAEITTVLDTAGRVVSTVIVNAGTNYSNDTTGLVKAAVLVRPHAVIVQSNINFDGRWTKHSFDYSLRTWVKTQTQKYNTPLFWKTIDWVSETYDSYKSIKYTISDLFALGSITSIADGEYVKVKNIGDGKYAILQKVALLGNYIPSYDIIYREQGTIQLLDNLWDYNLGKYAYDSATIEETLYDQIPDRELYYILIALKNNIFVNELKVNWNLFFFAAVKYAFTEQKLLDWAFKTSFINVFNNVGTLDQRPVYKLNNEKYFENYINEVKPYHTKIRSYVSKYNYQENTSEGAPLDITDFDLPAYYNTVSNSLAVVELGNPLLSVRPWKDWFDNYKFYVGAIEVGYAGSGYTQRPTVTITTATNDTGSGASAEAYIRNGEVYKVIVTNAGSGYVIPPIVTISNSNVGNDPARVSVIMSNDVVRKNIIGMKFDRTSTVGDIVDLTVSDEFVCDGTSDKFVLTWLASPDKRSITPLLDGKLIFSADYTIEYYQIKVAQADIDVQKAFPKNSWEGQSMVDHRYKYFLNTERSGELPSYIRHYAKFVFLNQVPKFGQIFKISYKKNIDLYNAVDRINSLYNPTDLMPGKELPLLINGAEYPGTSVQGLPFDQSPNWDSTGTRYDAAPWGDSINRYEVGQLVDNGRPVFIGDQRLQIKNVRDVLNIVPGSSIRVLNTSTKYFRDTTVVESVDIFGRVFFSTLDTADTQIKKIYSTGTASQSTVIIHTKDSFNTSIQRGDFIQVSGVNSLRGYGISFIGFTNLESTSTTTLVTITIDPPAFAGGRQATAYVVQDGFTVTSIIVSEPGMGYGPNRSNFPGITLNGINTTLVGTTATAFLDPGFNQVYFVTTCTHNYIETKTNLELSSTGTTLDSLPNRPAQFNLCSVIRAIEPSNKLLDTVVDTLSSSTVLSLQTFAPFNEVIRAEVSLNSVPILSTTTNTLWYSISNSIDGLNRATVSVRSIDVDNLLPSGTMEVKVFGSTELEFYSYNTNYSSLDSSITGSNFNDTSLGYRPEDIIVDGNNFLNSIDSYAPEECVPGVVRDAVGINVYTETKPSTYPMVISGSFAAGPDGITLAELTWLPETPLGFRVQSNGKTFERVLNQNSFTTSTQYCLFDKTIIVNTQPSNVVVGYSFVTAGSDAVVDSAYVGAEVVSETNTGTIAVSSLLSIDEVLSVYVLLNGQEMQPTANVEDLGFRGYILSPTASNNNRAMVTVAGLNSDFFNLEVWFFNQEHPKFNTIHEQFFEIGSNATSELALSRAPGGVEPVSQQVIVEKITTSTRTRLLPPWASYYKIQNGKMNYPIDPKNSDQLRFFTLDNVKVYLNGITLRPGYDFIVDGIAREIILVKPGIVAGDAIAIESLVDYEYIVDGNVLYLSTPLTTSTVKVTSFTDHDNLMMRTERFKANDALTLTFPVISENYVWVTVDSKPLTAGVDFKMLEDMKTIQFSEFVNFRSSDDILVVVINPLSYGSNIFGYRIFKDMFGRQQFRRISDYFSTKLAQPLQYTDDKIFLEDGDNLLQPNPARNLPGVVLIDGERIEYTSKDGNVLSGLRRSTLGTGPAKFSDIGTDVVDQSIRQTISTDDYSLIQNIPSSTTSTYIISKESTTDIPFTINTTTQVGNGIVLLNQVNAADQLEVYYGGRQLRKSSLAVHDKSISYYNSPASIEILPPEFTISTTSSFTLTSVNTSTVSIQSQVLYGNRFRSLMSEDKEFDKGNIVVINTGTSTYLQFITPITNISRWLVPGKRITINYGKNSSTSTIISSALGDFLGNPNPGKLGLLLSSNFVSSTKDVTSLEFLKGDRFVAKISLTIGNQFWSTSTVITALNTATSVNTIGTSTAIYSISPNLNDNSKALISITDLNPSVSSVINLSLYEYQQITLNIAEELTTGTRITVVKKEGAFWEDTGATSLVSSTGTQASFIRSRPTKLPDIYFYGGEKVLLENSIALTDENGEPLEGY
jgi:hypothetical protein